MHLQDVFSKLRNDEITVIGERVKAQFDNAQQTPLGFQWRDSHYEVLKSYTLRKTRKATFNTCC